MPASCANLGPGFDALAVAVSLYVEVTVRPSPRLSVAGFGEGAELAEEPDNAAVSTIASVLGHRNFSVEVRSEIPVARGLGSSAALFLAAAAAAGCEDPLSVAVGADGHAENAAASMFGGLVSAALVGERACVVPHALDPQLEFVVMVPDVTLSTKSARSVLPERVSLKDAVFNIGRMGLLLGGLASAEHLVGAATEDRLHQDARAALFPQARGLMAGFVESGARCACWSGAGPSILGICGSGEGESVAARAREVMQLNGVQGRAIVLSPDMSGLVVEDATVP